ncbi:hypothetical protein [Aestuariivita boseongensis]|uniref:hypothetical protein n=1 Tax=Aestuariivita boseongensis TaxID=1470562 RepID=UPI0006831E16|nr:hypothetical protein [Aestuariivita boseongensis]
MRHLAAFATAIAMLPLSAQAFTAKNRLTVAPVSNSVFEVVGLPGSGASHFWCAAGEYALAQGAASSARIYLASGRQPSVSRPGRTAVRFTLAPDAAGVTPLAPQLTLSVDVPGDNLSVAAAREYCHVSISRF